MSRALLIVDLQNDFMPWGALGVANGDAVIPVINRLQETFDCILASTDWHPAHHCSFASTHGRTVGEVIDLNGLDQILWPDHCVQGSEGAEFVDGLNLDKVEAVFEKGVDPQIDSYGAFFDNGRRRETGLEAYLRQEGIDHLFVVGLTTDYCVKYTVIDGIELGFKMSVITDACRPVDLREGDERQALDEMESAGATLIISDQLLE